MSPLYLQDLEVAIARARVVLSLVVLLVIYVDPATGGLFGIGLHALIILASHLVYSLAISLVAERRMASRRLPWITGVLDIGFAGALAASTENVTSPAFAMFLFSIVAVGCWAKLRVTILATSLCVVLYLCAIWLSVVNVTNAYLMRAVYLAIAGYLINFFGQEREKFEGRVREFETEAERHAIARSLHDGYIQSLAGIGLRLESCRDMLASNELAQAVAELGDIQISVDREFDEVRAYVRSLAHAGPASGRDACREAKTKFQVRAAFTGDGLLAEQILQIMLEGVRNARVYGQARSAAIEVREEKNGIRLTIDDDGVGFEAAVAPWTIASRVAECGGHLMVHSNISPGAHIEIEMPAS